ncbi:MAG: hypothetical protein IKT27_04365 [Clostridia bacterium]|nr:hypothetical protein [Clostridia bacterium]
METEINMDGWNLDEKKLKAEFDRKYPNYNKKRKCSICGATFASGKPRNICLGCAMKNGLFIEAPKRENKATWWTLKRIRLVGLVVASLSILACGYMTDCMGVAVLATIISIIAILT